MRPSWQIDLKWMLGLTACALIVVSGFLYSLSHVTKRDTAIPIASALVSAGIADRLSDQEYAQVQVAAQSAPANTVSLRPVALSLNGSEIAGLDKQAASAVVGGKLAGVMYDNGEAAAKALIVTPPAETGQEPVTLGPVGALTASNHGLFTLLFLVSISAALLALGGVAMLARGWGRLGAPSFIMFVGTAPLAALWVMGQGAIGAGDPGEGIFAQNARAAFDGAASDLSTLFMAITAAALACGLLCILGSMASMAATRAVNGVEEAAPPEPEAAPKPNVPRPQGQAEGLMRASASLAATTYRVSGTTQAVPKSEASSSKQNVA